MSVVSHYNNSPLGSRPQQKGNDHHGKGASLRDGASPPVRLACPLQQHVDNLRTAHHIDVRTEHLPWEDTVV